MRSTMWAARRARRGRARATACATLARMAWRLEDIPDQRGRTAIVTGANSGIGYETARALAARGAEVVLACRSPDKGAAALASLRTEMPDACLTLKKLDLASLQSIREFADAFRGEHGRLDVLVNNAGVMAIPRCETEDGFEMQFGTNHLGHFALTGLLLGRLLATPGARVVTVSSQMHRFGTIRFDDLMGTRHYDRWSAYSQSKLANLLFTYELHRRLVAKHASPPPVLALACHPGYAATELQGKGAHMRGSRVEALVMRLGNALFAQSATAGALPTLRAATDPEAQGGDYFGPDGLLQLAGRPVKVSASRKARDPELARRLWERSVDLTGVDFGGL